MTPPPYVTRDLLATGAAVGLARDVVTRFLRSAGLDRHAETGRWSIITELNTEKGRPCSPPSSPPS
jgi:hypothetical protein